MSIANSTDIDMPFHYSGSSFSEGATRSTARRLRRTRQHLGSYRHDLLVAIRVVNNIEREMIKAEWENWLLDENTRCKQLEMILREDQTGISPTMWIRGINPQPALDAQNKEKRESLKQWQKEYCGSCLREREMLFEHRER